MRICVTAILLSLFLPTTIIGQQQFEEPFQFYVFEMPEAAGLFQHTLRYMGAMESGEMNRKDEIENLLDSAYIRDIESYEMTSIFLRAYFRETRNGNVQSIVSEYTNGEIPTDERVAIERMYKAVLREIGSDGAMRYNLDDDFYEEEIYFSRPVNISTNDGYFQSYLPSGNWQTLRFSENDSRTTFMAGGQTAALSVNLDSRTYDVLPSLPGHSRNNIIYDVSRFGVHAQNNADLTILEFKENGDDYFAFELRLYDEDIKEVSTISYEYYISPININYKVFDVLKKHLLYYSFLSHLTN